MNRNRHIDTRSLRILSRFRTFSHFAAGTYSSRTCPRGRYFFSASAYALRHILPVCETEASGVSRTNEVSPKSYLILVRRL